MKYYLLFFVLVFSTPLFGAEKKHVLCIGGPKSHSYGVHAHSAGFKLIEQWLNEHTDSIRCTVHLNGWPEDPEVLEGVDCLVINCDGGKRHLALKHLDQLRKFTARGGGIMMIHYAVVMPKGEGADFMLDTIGGYYEEYWSVHPFYDAVFKELPKHPVTRGVKPFTLNEDWFFHMRFRENREGIVPLLSCVPPDEAREGPDGPHSGNPVVRSEKGKTEIVSWCVERPDGGRSLAFNGLNTHWNWAHPQFRKFILNAIVWTAGAEVPENGVETPTPTWEELERNQDHKPNMKPEEIQQWKERIKTWDRENRP